jgi:hypothetical protein
MPRNGGYKLDWAEPLLAILGKPPQSQPRRPAPIASIDEQSLDQILNKVGEKFVPPDLNRTALRIGIAKAIETKEKIDRYRPKRSRAAKKSVKRIREAAKALDTRLKENHEVRRLIGLHMPRISEDILTLICMTEVIEQTLGESNKDVRSRYARPPSAKEWLTGIELPLVFEEFCHRKAGRSRGVNAEPGGPTVRFVTAVMEKLNLPVSPDSVIRAMTRFSDLRERRRAIRQRDIGQT